MNGLKRFQNHVHGMFEFEFQRQKKKLLPNVFFPGNNENNKFSSYIQIKPFDSMSLVLGKKARK
jgi:hypothetical protein